MKTENKLDLGGIICLMLLVVATTFGLTKAYYQKNMSEQSIMEQAMQNIDHIEYANEEITIIDKQYNEWIFEDVENVEDKTEQKSESKNELLELAYNKEVTHSVKVFYTNSKDSLNEMFDFIEQKNGEIVIEISNGTVLDKESGDGLADNGSYICYEENTYEPGTRISSVFVYNSETNYTDDIAYRQDTIIK